MLHTTFTVCSTAALQVAALHAAVFWLNLTHFNCMHPAPASLQPTSYNTTPVHPGQLQYTPIYTLPWSNRYQYLNKFYLQGSTCLERSCQAAAPSPRPSPRPSRRPGTRSQLASTGETSSQFRSISTQTSSSWVLYLSSLALVRAGGDVKCLKNFHSFSQLARMSFAANTDLI